ncbi:hypothetical protein MPSEU_000665700 [Mayamaea pseudoterrestris]|nr:hypothetical protein MPSEU_000665700 [Mayamaea pseudoterrestris]
MKATTGFCSFVKDKSTNLSHSTKHSKQYDKNVIICCSRNKITGLQRCLLLEDIVVVHAYTDTAYNRSSFHFAGGPSQIASIASDLVSRVFDRVSGRILESDAETDNDSSAHPTVGLVDHIAVMPLEYTQEINTKGLKEEGRAAIESSPFSHTPSALIALQIGQTIKARHSDQQILYYGDAHPSKTSLATIRRDFTDFFRPSSNASTRPSVSIITIGAPTHGFVENYNVRLHSKCPRKLATTLTKRIRMESNGKVEALTLAYSHGRHEVATNLLEPSVYSAEQVQAVVDDWELGNGQALVECGYRVGTTVEQCLEAILATGHERIAHDDQVRQQQERYLRCN